MEKLTRIQALLSRISESEGPDFKYDEDAIVREYELQDQDSRALSVKVISIIGSVLASVALLAFLGWAVLYGAEDFLLLVGLVFMVAAVVINRSYATINFNIFTTTLYITGTAVLIFGLVQERISYRIIAIVVGSMGLISMFVSRTFLLTFVSILIVTGSFLFFCTYELKFDLLHLYNASIAMATALVFLMESRIIANNNVWSRLYNPLRIGLVLSFLAGLVMVGVRDLLELNVNYLWLSSIVSIILNLYIVSRIIDVVKLKGKTKIEIIYTLAAILLVPTLFAPAIAGTILLILLSFLVNYKTGFYLGIIASIYFISQYYYDLNFTLLTKSVIMLITGIVFIILYLLTINRLSKDE